MGVNRTRCDLLGIKLVVLKWISDSWMKDSFGSAVRRSMFRRWSSFFAAEVRWHEHLIEAAEGMVVCMCNGNYDVELRFESGRILVYMCEVSGKKNVSENTGPLPCRVRSLGRSTILIKKEKFCWFMGEEARGFARLFPLCVCLRLSTSFPSLFFPFTSLRLLSQTSTDGAGFSSYQYNQLPEALG